jgi:alcohol dehydrogenase class IV
LAAIREQEESAMACCHHYFTATEGGEDVFSVDVSSIAYGPGALREAGEQARALGIGRIALFTDRRLAALEHVAIVKKSLADAGVDTAVYDEVRVEPTDESFQAATRFAEEARVDGYISVGGGSVIDTAKAADLYATHPAAFLAYVNAPVGEGRPVPGALKPHIACPTTSGTGSECTGIAVFDLLSMKAKTGIASRHLRPTLALIDPLTTHTLPANVVACSAFDVLSHALESYTSQPFTRRTRSRTPAERPMSQGANPWSDLGCREALRLAGKYMVRAVADASDHEAREQLMWASTLAGIAFGNSGVHVPHGMAYAVTGLVRDYRPEGYPDDEPIIPHGMSVIVNAPSVFRNTATACPERHLEGAECLGAEVRGAGEADAGEVVGTRIIELMKPTGIPNGIGGVGYGEADIEALIKGTLPQQRLLKNAPMEVGAEQLSTMFEGALSYW